MRAHSLATGLAVAAATLATTAVGWGASGAGAATSNAAGPSTTVGRTALAVPVPAPRGAVVGGALPAGQTVSVDVALATPDPGAVSAFVTAVSTPSSPRYRQYLAPGQFAAQFGPDSSTVAAVSGWLTGLGLSVGSVSADGLLLPVEGPAATVAAAFGTSLSSVRLPSGRQGYTDTAAPTIPSSLAGAIRGVVGLSNLAHWHADLAAPTGSSATGSSATGSSAAESPATGPSATTAETTGDEVTAQAAAPQACTAAARKASPGGPQTFTQLADAYDMSTLYGQGRTGAGVTVALYELEPYSPNDISTFEQCYGIATPVGNVTVDGGPGKGSGIGEAALDIEDVAALAPDSNILVYQGPNATTDLPGSGPLDTMDRIAADDRARVVSSSWGVCETTPSLTSTAVAAESRIFQVMAAQGQTMLAASGDSGSEDCWYPGNRDFTSHLAVEDPAGQPDVTGVGGTTLPVGGAADQTVWNDCQSTSTASCAQSPSAGASGGGISADWTMPTWQSAAGHGTLNPYSSALPCGGGATLCREVPDVAADADPGTGYVIYHGSWGVVGGTSASTPLWGAMIALADQGCNGSVGLANPALYQLGSNGSGAFTDVTVAGDNDLTRNQVIAGVHAYPTATGYDLDTGWGSPVGATLLAGLQPSGGCPAVTGLSSAHGPLGGGTTITIAGTDLAGATSVHFGALSAPIVAGSASQVTVNVPAGPYAQVVDVTVTTANGTSAAVAEDRYTMGTPRTGAGYWLGAADGGIFAFGNAQFHGSMGGQPLNKPVVGLAATADDGGYWEVASDGGIFAFGNAQFYGSMGGQPLNQPIVGLAVTPDGQGAGSNGAASGGYWEVASDGGIFAFGNAQFYGSMGGQPLNQPIVGLAVTPDGQGYWEVASDGGIFAFGDAQFYGSMGGQPLNRPIVAIAAIPDGRGYWEVASDGGIFAFGDAQFYGSMGGQPLNRPIVAVTATPDAGGYWEVASDGGIFAFGDAQFYGSTGALSLAAPIVGMAGS